MRIEDINSISEALRAGMVNKILVRKDLRSSRIRRVIEEAKKEKIPVSYIQDKKIRISADVSPVKYADLDEIIQKCTASNSFMVFLDSVEDPNNLGAVIRSAEFFGCSGIIIPKRRAVQLSDTIAKVSAGAVFHIAITRVSNLAMSLKKVKKYGISVVGLELDGKELINVDLSPPVAFVVGGEDRGISSTTKKQCDSLIKITGRGKVSSLNLSVASAIIMHEFVRRNEYER
jgi:23S rRNA (guanosine2251-2'-O)-methyltransferase